MTQTEISIENHSLRSEYLLSYDGTKLHVYCWAPMEVAPSYIMVIIHGMGGHGGYYASSLAPYLAPAGGAIYAPDLRGHGKSEGKRGHVESFTELEGDVAEVVRWARRRHPDLPLFLLGESMGTPLAITYAANSSDDLRPDFLALVACVVAPTIQPRVDEIFRTAFYLVTGPRKVAIPITGREEQGTRDPAFVKMLKSDVLFNKRISVRFLLNMTRTMNRAAKLHHHLTMPTLVMLGGKDITIRHRATRNFFKRIAAADKELHVFPDAFHAILNDPDSPQVRARLLAWIERQCRVFVKKEKAG